MTASITNGIYYEDGQPKHAGVVKVDGVIYYAGSGGVLATGEKTVHREMSNGILKRGVYRFGSDGKLDESFYIPPEKRSRGKKRKSRRASSKKLLALCATGALLLLVLSDLIFGWLPTPGAPVPSAAYGESAPGSAYGESVPSLTQGETEAEERLALPSFQEPVYLCTDSMREFYQGRRSLQEAISAGDGAYAPFCFPYALPQGSSGVLILEGGRTPLSPEKNSVMLDNLMTGKTYEYSVELTREDGQISTYRGSFTTAPGNRFITLPGVLNTRDIGGYVTQEGKRVKQGMIIRGTELDGLVESELFLTDREAAEPFGFQTDLDLRADDIFAGSYQSRLGEGVSHAFYNSPAYSGIFTADGQAKLRTIFQTLADPESYPIYLHCTYGADRTGTVVYLLQGILGISDRDKELEYRLTGFYMEDFGSNTFLNGIFGGLDSLPGKDINEKIRGFMTREVGLSQEELDSIRGLLLENR